MSDRETALPFLPVSGTLVGETKADNVRHMLVRIAFGNTFRRDERVEAICHEWGVRYRVEPVAVELAQTLEALAKATDTANRGLLLEKMSELDVADDGRTVTVEHGDQEGVRFVTGLSENQHLIDRVNELADQLGRCFQAIDSRVLIAEACEFVKSLGLPWPWLAIEVIESFGYGLSGFTQGQVYKVNHWVEPPDPEVPKLTFRFATRAEETAAEAANRLLVGVGRFLDRLSDGVPEVPRGHIPSDYDAELRDGIGRYGRWFYRNRLRGESINAIARGANCDRATVRRGIREAERLLNLTAYSL